MIADAPSAGIDASGAAKALASGDDEAMRLALDDLLAEFVEIDG